MIKSRNDVLFILPSLNGGGAERVTLSLLRALDRTCWSPTLMLLRRESGALEAEIPPDVAVIRLNATRARSALVGILRNIWRLRPDIVFVTLDHMNAMMGLLRPLMPRGTKLVLRVTDFGSLGVGRLRWSLGIALRMSDLVIYQSEAMSLAFRGALRLGPDHRGVVIPNAMSLQKIRAAASSREFSNEFSRAENEIRLVAAGRLVAAKGFDLLIDAIGLVADPRLRLFILGEGPLRSELTSRIIERRLTEQVRLCGFQANPYAWFSRAEVFLLSSRSEGFPNVVLEALACGVPVISTPLPGLACLPSVMLTDGISAAAIAQKLAEWTETRSATPDGRVEAMLAKHDAPVVALKYDAVLKALV